jgi:hypothetical protein
MRCQCYGPSRGMCCARVGRFALSSKPRSMEGKLVVWLMDPCFCIKFCWNLWLSCWGVEYLLPPFLVLLLVFTSLLVFSSVLLGNLLLWSIGSTELPCRVLQYVWVPLGRLLRLIVNREQSCGDECGPVWHINGGHGCHNALFDYLWFNMCHCSGDVGFA